MMMKRFALTLGSMVLLTSTTFVMAAQQCSGGLPSATSTQRFNDHGNGTLTDSRTGLMWKKCLEGQEGRSCGGSGSRMSWEDAANTAQLSGSDRFAGQAGWRLPTLAELRSLVEQGCTAPAANLEVFPHMLAVGLWSSDQEDPRAWSLDFAKGKSYKNFKGAGMYVRLVRNR
jgi:hypothetical protein